MRLLLHPALPHTHPPLPVELAVSTRFTTADLARPVSPIHLLGGGGLTAALSAAGTGVVTSGGADLTRWRADRVEDADGLALFLRDLDTGHVWTAGWRPGDEAYEARFGVGMVEIVRQDAGVETRLCLAVAPEGALVGRLQLRSLDGRARRIEVTTLAELEEALAAGARIIMLDNMDNDTLREAVTISAGRAKLEASGGVKLERVRSIAETGVDYISTSQITMGATPLDLGLDVIIRAGKGA